MVALPGFQVGVTAIHFTPNGRFVAGAGQDGNLRYWYLDHFRPSSAAMILENVSHD